MIPLATASRFAEAGLANAAREYPYNPGHLLTGPESLRPHRELHPVFYGCYDWHSCVHTHWMLARLVRLLPDLPQAEAVRRHFETRLTDEAVAIEAEYFREPARRTFQRPYGWAWLLTLHGELWSWPEPQAATWASRLEPLVAVLRGRTLEWLRAGGYPNRVGLHANSAFAMGLVYDYAAATRDPELKRAVVDAAMVFFSGDTDYPAWLEPSGADFLSPALVEADLMGRILHPASFAGWFERFLPDPQRLTEPARVIDRTDAQFVHLDGLNLSRAWCWSRIARRLPADHRLATTARDAAVRHAEAALPHAVGGDYVGDHWLPTFAVYLLTEAEPG